MQTLSHFVRTVRSLAFTRDFLLEEYLFNFPAVKPGGRGRRARAKGREGEGNAMGKGNFPSVRRHSKERKRQRRRGRTEGVLVARSTVERQEIRIEMRQRNEMSTLSER